MKFIFYKDFDNDGYGNKSIFQEACSAPNGYVSDNTDCNDRNANVNPGETEICNGIDDDCDGQIDEGFTSEDCEEKCLIVGGADFNIARNFGLKCCGDDNFEDNPFEIIEQSCEDNNDNDCDGQIDCEDLDCVYNPVCIVYLDEDVNQDQIVDIKDLVAVAVVFGTMGCDNENNHCNRADVNRNGRVEISDLVKVVVAFD